MGFIDRLLTGAGIVAAGLLAGSAYKDAQETRRRRTSPLCLDDGLTQSEFIALARDIGKRTPRVADVAITGMSVTLFVRSNSGLSTWTAEIDFNDYGHLTGTYWLSAENADSLIPKHFAQSVAGTDSKPGRRDQQRTVVRLAYRSSPAASEQGAQTVPLATRNAHPDPPWIARGAANRSCRRS